MANFDAFWRDKNFSENVLFLGSEIHYGLMDDSSVNFWTMLFFIFCQIFCQFRNVQSLLHLIPEVLIVYLKCELTNIFFRFDYLFIVNDNDFKQIIDYITVINDRCWQINPHSLKFLKSSQRNRNYKNHATFSTESKWSKYPPQLSWNELLLKIFDIQQQNLIFSSEFNNIRN